MGALEDFLQLLLGQGSIMEAVHGLSQEQMVGAVFRRQPHRRQKMIQGFADVTQGHGPAGGLVIDAAQHPVGPGLVVAAIQGHRLFELIDDLGQQPAGHHIAGGVGPATQIEGQPIVALNPVGVFMDKHFGINSPLLIEPLTVLIGGQLPYNEAGPGQLAQDPGPGGRLGGEHPFIQAQGLIGLTHI